MWHEERVYRHQNFLETKFLVISGPSGGGKTTLCTELTQTLKPSRVLIKHTNRALRQGEKNGVDYYFVDSCWFNKSIRQRTLLAYADRYNSLYALSLNEVVLAVNHNELPIFILDVHLALKFKATYKGAILVFVGPAKGLEIKDRLLRRGDHSDEVKSRIEIVDEEITLRSEFNLSFITPCDVNDMVEDVRKTLIDVGLFT